MGAVNLSIAYPPASTINSILNTLLDALTSTNAFAGAGNGLGFSQVEDSITSDSLFVVQANQPSNVKSRMIIEVRHAFIQSVDYLAFVVWDAWTPGSPGSGGNSVLVTDPTSNPTIADEKRFHKIDPTNGGDFFLDGDDLDGRWLSVHSKADGADNETGHFVMVCSIEKSVHPNFGVLAWTFSGLAFELRADEDANGCMWIPPVNHEGFASDTHVTTFQPSGDRAAYLCHAPTHTYAAKSGIDAAPICGASANFLADDTYSGEDIVYPLYIHNSSLHAQSAQVRNANIAFGFRGFARGVFGYRRGAASPTRFNLDVTGGLKYVVYAGDPLATAASVPRYAVERT